MRTLAALIPAIRAADDAPDMLRATLPFAGRALVEHQARLAAEAGAAHVVLLVERVPADLVAAVDRLRRDGTRVSIVRSLAEAIDRIHPEEALLLIADGCATDAETARRMALAPVPTVLTLPDGAAHAAFERIDASARWAGLLLTDGARLRRVAAMLGDWDLESTLLRSAVQESAARMPAGAVPPRLATGAATLGGAEAALLAAPPPPEQDWSERLFAGRIARAAAPALVTRGVDPTLIEGAAVGAAALGAAAVAAGGWRPALLLLLLAAPLRATARRVAAMRLAPILRARELASAREAALAAALLLLAAGLAPARGWGSWPLAAVTIFATYAAHEARRRLGPRAARWRIGGDDLVLLAIPFGFLALWLPVLWVLAVASCAALLATLRAAD